MQVVSALVISACAAQSRSSVTVETSKGAVHGYQVDLGSIGKVNVFRGIPFADTTAGVRFLIKKEKNILYVCVRVQQRGTGSADTARTGENMIGVC